MCPFSVGGGGSSGAEDGDGAGQDEVHPAALQVPTTGPGELQVNAALFLTCPPSLDLQGGF